MKTIAIYWKSISWALIVAVLLLMPTSKLPHHHFFNFEHFDKVVHLGLFAIFEFLLLYDFRNRDGLSGFQIRPTAIAAFYGSITEILQLLLTQERDASWLDFIADIAGCLVGIVLYRIFLVLKDRFYLRNS